ncbi:hypothetical protein Glove_376g2 [Diversispora epigaea]|uniref:MULE transposase domain-containing protein n=1 Tax=Diversispora epigaea TaxID=1348612 RepID=A0A397H4R2_9GLOM|nr:hypothetical protein Glove_376g2 [Diversispora epigaea]
MSLTQIALWLEYHDVILNDNTAKTNCYQMPLSLFLVIDNNTRSRLVAQALVSDEMTESYKWILECTKNATITEPLVFVTDADPAADAAIGQIYIITYQIHCIFHISENLPKNLKSKLCDQYENFSNLVEKYPSVKDYLMRVLYPNRQTWVRAFTSKIFTAGIQTTSCIEGLNNIIKRELQANSTLCDLAIGNDLFSEIDKIMSKYLTPHILSAECLEMTQCLYFTANKVEPDIVEDSSVNITDGFIEDLYDSKQILLKLMIAEVGRNFREIWKIADMRPENKKYVHFVVVVDPISYLCSYMFNITVMIISTVAGFQIQMVPLRWYIDDQKDKDIVAKTCYFVNQEVMQNFSGMTFIPNPSTVPITVTIVLLRAAKKKVKYGELWGLARQVTQFAVEDDSYSEMVGWLRQFINRHKEMAIAQTSGTIWINLCNPSSVSPLKI